MDVFWSLHFFERGIEHASLPVVDSRSDKRQPDKRFCCAICNAYVTDDAQAAHIQQQHIHTRSNPQGQSFRFGCFHTAPGCRISGDATDEHTWFQGYRWRFVYCKSCQAQLGWHFSGDRDFFALILEQLIECRDNGDPD